MNRDERTERLEAAYETAWFIHHSKSIAYLIALEAVYRWEALPPQGQRLLSKTQKFQRLVFEISEYFESALEAISCGDQDEIDEQVKRLAVNMRHLEAPELSITSRVKKYLSLLTPVALNLEERLMMTHYLKHLALMAYRHSRVKATVSLMQLLYRYPTNQTREIYEVLENLMQESGESKDLQFFAKARRELLDELKARFQRSLQLEPRRATNGAMTYQITASSATAEQAEYIQDCLREFAPCDVRRTASLPEIIREKGEFIFQLFYPEQFHLTLLEAGITSHSQPLFWPVFANIRMPANPPPPGQCPPLRERERRTAAAYLGQASTRRRQWNGKTLRIVVDGREAALIDLDRRDRCRLDLDAAANSIEVIAPSENGDLLLAQYMLCDEDFDPAAGPMRYATPLGGGREIIFAIEPQANGDGGQIFVSLQEPRLKRRAAMAPGQFLPNWKLALSAAAATITAFFGFAAGQALMFSHHVAWADISPPAVIATPSSAKSSQSSTTLGTLGTRSPGVSGQALGSEKKQSLCETHNFLIEIDGNETALQKKAAAEVARKMTAPASALSVISDRSKAQATLKINAAWRYGVIGWLSNVAVVDATLEEYDENGHGATLWPAAGAKRRYEGGSDNVIDAIAQDLSEAWREDCRK